MQKDEELFGIEGFSYSSIDGGRGRKTQIVLAPESMHQKLSFLASRARSLGKAGSRSQARLGTLRRRRITIHMLLPSCSPRLLP